MKRKIILTLIMSAILLTACNKNIQSAHTEQDVTTTETAKVAANYETEQTEETSISETETSAEEQSEPELILPENMKLLNTAKLNDGGSGLGFLKGSIYCELLGGSPHFYDINTQTLEAKIDLPAGGRSFINQTDDSCLCKIRAWSEENDSDQVITVYRDYTYDIADYAPETVSFSVCGHNIAEYGYDIVDTDKNVKILEGGIWENSENYGYRFLFEIDENRFVYQKCGDIESFGFGIYNFETGSDIDIPDTVWHTPFGFYDGKIYSMYCIENEHTDKFPDGVYGDIYVTDIETGEKQHGFDCPLSDSDYISYEYAMPENGEFIALLATSYELETPYAFCIIDPDTGDITRKYEVSCRKDIVCRSIWFADNDTAVISDRGGNKLIIADLNR